MTRFISAGMRNCNSRLAVLTAQAPLFVQGTKSDHAGQGEREETQEEFRPRPSGYEARAGMSRTGCLQTVNWDRRNLSVEPAGRYATEPGAKVCSPKRAVTRAQQVGPARDHRGTRKPRRCANGEESRQNPRCAGRNKTAPMASKADVAT